MVIPSPLDDVVLKHTDLLGTKTHESVINSQQARTREYELILYSGLER